MDKIRVYIASPYTNGDKQKLTDLQSEAAAELLRLGFNPFTPLLSHYIVLKDNELVDFDWIEVDLQWLKLCDIAVRLHPKDKFGVEIPSSGADKEEETCKKLGIPMFHFDTIEEMTRFFETFVFEK